MFNISPMSSFIRSPFHFQLFTTRVCYIWNALWWRHSLGREAAHCWCMECFRSSRNSRLERPSWKWLREWPWTLYHARKQMYCILHIPVFNIYLYATSRRMTLRKCLQNRSGMRLGNEKHWHARAHRQIGEPWSKNLEFKSDSQTSQLFFGVSDKFVYRLSTSPSRTYYPIK